MFEKQDGESRTGSCVGMRRLLLDRPAVPNHPTTRPFLSRVMSINIKRPIRKQKYVRGVPSRMRPENLHGQLPSRCCGAGAPSSTVASRRNSGARGVELSVLLTTRLVPCVLCSGYSTLSLSTHVHRHHVNHQGMSTIKVKIPARLRSRMEVSGQSQASRNHQGGRQRHLKGQHL